MEVQLLDTVPQEWISKKPIETYETRFLYIGFSRYDTTKQTLTKFVKQDDGTVLVTDASHKEAFFARCYHTEHARVTIYSLSPRVWTEEVDTLQCFVQVQHPTHAS